MDYQIFQTEEDTALFGGPSGSVLGQKNKVHCSCCCKPCRCRTRRSCVLWVLFCCLLGVATMAVSVEHIALPLEAQHIIDLSHMSFDKMELLGAEGNIVSMAGTATFILPFDPSFSATVHSFTATMLYQGTQCRKLGGCPIGTFLAPELKLVKGEVEQSFDIKARLVVYDTDNFGLFGEDMVNLDSVPWGMTATIAVSLSVEGIPLSTSGITVNKTFSFPGYGGFSNTTVDSFDLFEDQDNVLKAAVNATIYSPSDVVLKHMGDLHLAISYNNVTMGRADIYNVSILPQANNFRITGTISPSNQKAFNELISRYLARDKDISLLLSPSIHFNSSSIPLYEPIARAIRLNAVLPPVAHPLGMQILFNITGGSIWEWLTHRILELPTRILMHNPVGVAINFKFIDFSVFWNGTKLGSTNGTIDFTLPPHSSVWDPPSLAVIDWRHQPQLHDEVTAFLQVIQQGYTLAGIRGSFIATVGNQIIEPYYWQPETMPCCVDGEMECMNYTLAHPTWPLCPSVCDITNSAVVVEACNKLLPVL